MAASTSTSPSVGVYDIFINHRGPDVKMTFASHLYRRLISHGLKVFLDYRELNVGEEFPPEIKGAIASASVHIAIFSPTYADSKWCLEELQLMLDSHDSGSVIIPVFYRVEPADLRRTHEQDNGVYALALRRQEKKRAHDGQPRYNSTTVEEWRKALSRAADITGFNLDAFNADEGELLDKVIECVLKSIKKPQLEVATHPTGLEEKVQDFETKVLWQQDSGTLQVVLIAGIGGVGKTTLAIQLFNSKRVNYSKYNYFLFDVRENAAKSLISLQNKLLKGLNLLDRDIESVAEGKMKLREYLKGSKVLMVLDDIDKVDQVHALLPLDVLHPNSFILITSRDKNVLASLGKGKSSIYHLTGLDDHHSRKLFCSYAFCQPHPSSGFESLVDRFLKACQGLPLSLKVIGTLVFGSTEHSEWEDQLTKLQQILPHEIQQRLKISYDALDEQEKNIFLDIACFFIGEERDMAIRIWNGSGWTGSVGFRTLQNKCLVELDMENKVRMHDHLRDLGRDLAKHPELPHRLWNIDDLKHHSYEMTKMLRGIQVLLSENSDDTKLFYHIISNNNYEDEDDDEDNEEYNDKDEDDHSSHQTMMLRKRELRKKLLQLNEVKGSKLQLLDVDFLSEQVLSGVHSPNLIWLRWHECHLSSLPSWISMEDLRVLEVRGKVLQTLWQHKKVPSQLRELSIFAPLQNIPKSIGNLKQLEKLHLDLYCEESPAEVGELSTLKELNIGKLSALKELVIENSLFVIRGLGELTNLRKVDVRDCSNFQELLGLENLRPLEELQIYRCAKLKSIRGSAKLTKLRKVDVRNCSDLEMLPGFENLRSLEELRVLDCRKLKSIGGSSELRELRDVYVSDCSGLEEMTGFENLRSLVELHVSGCEKLKSIHGSGEFTKLRNVYVSDCSDLEDLPSFENLRLLEEFHVHKCGKLKHILGSELTKLQKIDVRDCSDLEELRGFENLSSLEELLVLDCGKLKSIWGLTELRKLRKANVSGCSDLEELPGFKNSRSLEELLVRDCGKVKSIRGSEELTKLRKVQVFDCSDLEELPGFEDLSSLEELVVQHCGQLKSIRGSAKVTKIRIVDVPTCFDLEELPGFEDLSSLEELQIYRCAKLKSIRGSAKLTKLRKVDVFACSDLEELPGFEDLSSLEELVVQDCGQLKSIRGSAKLTKLREVDVRRCSDLEELPGFEDLSSLEELVVQHCGQLKSIRGSAKLTNLRKVYVWYCSSLEELPGFENLRALEELDVHNCGKLKSIRGSAELTKLRFVSVKDCSLLEELQGFENLSSLEELDVHNCGMLKSIRGSAELTKLRKVYVTDCSHLEELQGFENLRSLEELQVHNCGMLKEHTGIGGAYQASKNRYS